MEFRTIEHSTGVRSDHTTILYWVKQIGQQLIDTPQKDEIPELSLPKARNLSLVALRASYSVLCLVRYVFKAPNLANKDLGVTQFLRKRYIPVKILKMTTRDKFLHVAFSQVIMCRLVLGNGIPKWMNRNNYKIQIGYFIFYKYLAFS